MVGKAAKLRRAKLSCAPHWAIHARAGWFVGSRGVGRDDLGSLAGRDEGGGSQWCVVGVKWASLVGTRGYRSLA